MFKTFCALCGIKTSFKLLNIISSSCDGVQVYDLIPKYLHIEIKSNVLCSDCLEQLQKFHKYYERVHQSQKIILSLITAKYNNTISNTNGKKANFEEKHYNNFKEDTIEILKIDIAEFTHSGDSEYNDENLQKSKDPYEQNDNLKNNILRKEENNLSGNIDRKRKRKRSKNDFTEIFENADKKKISFLADEDLKNINYDADKEVDFKISKFMDLVCTICEEKFSTFNRIMRHYHNTHQIRGYINCCCLKFYTRIELIDHIDTSHLDSARLTCRVCDKRLATTRSLRRHMINLHRWKKEELYPCDVCPNVSFSKRVDLKKHKFEIHSSNSYVCFKCKRTFKNEVNLLFHKENIHNRKSPTSLMCDLCGKIFKTSGGFYKHTKEVHEGKIKGRRECEVCGSLVKNLEYHKKMAHPPDGTVIKCKECDKEMKTWFALKSHRANVHLVDKRKFPCNVCEKGFKNQKLLLEHNASHTGQPLYACDYCYTTFKHESNYLKHKKRQHVDEWTEEKRNKYLSLKRSD